MGRQYKNTWTEAKLNRYIKEGRGQGTYQDYKPWVQVGDFSSRGRSHRIPGWKSNRIHHLLSDHEKRVFLLLEWAECVVDIREQFPLLDLELALRIANDMGIKYPTDPESKQNRILTTDFMVSVKRGDETKHEVITCKLSQDLDKKTVAAKLEIERRYFLKKGINWKIITEKDYPALMVNNIELVHESYHLEEDPPLSKTELLQICEVLKKRLRQPNLSIQSVTENLDREMDLKPGKSLEIFRYLLANKQVITDFILVKIDTKLSTSMITKII